MSSIRMMIVCLLSVVSIAAFGEEAAAPKMAMTTTAFLDEGIIPVLYTCDGKNISPQLDWTETPAKTETFALVLSDPNATNGTFYHWVLYNIPKKTSSLPEGMKTPPAGTLVGTNSWKKSQYNGPCPPKGASHRYVFKLYALDTKLTLPANADAQAVLKTMQQHVIGETKLTGVYSRWLN